MTRSFLKNKNQAVTLTIVVAAIGLLGYGGYGFSQRYQATHSEGVTISQGTVTQSVATPEETSPSESCQGYQVEANQPRKIEIANINVNACIQRVGIDQHNAIAVPDNIHLAGWYVGSVRPAEKGVSIIDGHVSGRYSDAIFSDLQQVTPGDEIRIEMGDKTTHVFKVIDTHEYTVAETTDKMFDKIEQVESQLTLITCVGAYDEESATFDRRTVVRAELKR